jgi:hypothetical protein
MTIDQAAEIDALLTASDITLRGIARKVGVEFEELLAYIDGKFRAGPPKAKPARTTDRVVQIGDVVRTEDGTLASVVSVTAEGGVWIKVPATPRTTTVRVDCATLTLLVPLGEKSSRDDG